ncbi:MAG: ABC transporter ATP-binding protein [Aerococcus sp.]|nr:ABC transporter ATP-binding protein [Aerococcus sp.]
MTVRGVFKKNWHRAILALGAKGIESILELLVPLVMANIIDTGINQGDWHYVFWHGLWLIILPLMGYLCAVFCQWNASVISQTVGTELRNGMYEQMVRLDLKQIDTLTPSSLVTRMTNDTVNIQDAVARLLRFGSRAPILLGGSIVMATLVSRELAPIFIIGGLLIGGILAWITVVANRRYLWIQKRLDGLGRLVRENLHGIRDIRAFANQDNEIERFDQANHELITRQTQVGRIQAFAMPSSLMIVNIAIALILYFGAWLVNNGLFMQGEIVALVNYMNTILQALQVLVNIIIIFSRGVVGMRRVDEFLALKPTIEDQTPATVPATPAEGMAVTLQDVDFHYGKKNVIQDVTIPIEPGQFVGIIGGTGAGKTTLINLLPRFYEHSTGALLLNGQPIEKWPLHTLRDRIALVPQKATLITGTLKTNLLMANPTATEREMWEALEIAQAADFVREKGDGLDLTVEQGGMNFSGGQRQRLTIARAIVKHAPLIILDDAVSALDFQTERKLRDALKALHSTVILVSQRVSSLRSADQILVLDHGQVAGLGTHEELIETSQTYQEIYYSQYPDEEVET